MQQLANLKLLNVNYGQVLVLALMVLLAQMPLSYGQVVNGDFSAGATGWTTIAPGTSDSVTFTGGVLTATGNDIGATTTGPNLQTFGQQTFTAGDPGFLSYTLVSYTSTDIGDFDFPIVLLDGVTSRIATDGSLGGTPSVNNGNQITSPISGVTTLAAGARTIAFGIQTLDSGFGAGIATWDNIDFQEITNSPVAQSTPENQPLTLSGANAPQTATNTSASMTVTLSVSNGILNLGSPGSVTITGGGDGTANITFTGTPTQVNTAMAGLVYSPNLGFNGAETLVFTVSGSGIIDTDNIAITVIPANPSLSITKTASAPGFTAGNIQEAPVGTVITYTYVVTNDGDQPIANITLSDAHTGSGPAPVPGGESLSSDTGTIGDSTDSGINGSWDLLAVGDAVTFTATYTVTQNDVDTLQ